MSTWIADTMLHLTGPPALVLIFALPALEASTPVGVLFPGEVALLLGGVLAHAGRVPLWGAVTAGVGGAVVGDSVGYVIGRWVGPRLLARPPLRVPPDRIQRATELLRRLGGRAVFVGRFTAGLRALVPTLAGVAAMPYRTFALCSAFGGLLWGSAVVLLGDVVGAAYGVVERTVGEAGLLLVGLLLGGAGGVVVLRRHRTLSQPGP